MKSLLFITFIGLIGLCGCYRSDYYYYRHFEAEKVEFEIVPNWQHELIDSNFYIRYFSDRDEYICPPSMFSINSAQRYPFFRIGKYKFTMFNFASIPFESLKSKYSSLLLSDSLSDNARFSALLIVDTISKEVITHPNGVLNKSDVARTYKTDNYVYIEFLKDYHLSGGWTDTMYYNPGIILIDRTNPLNISQYSFSNEYIHIVQEAPNKQLRVVTDRVEFKTSFLTYVVSLIAGHSPAQFMVTTNEFYEYIFDSSMNIVSKRLLNEDDMEVATIKNHHIHRYVDSINCKTMN